MGFLTIRRALIGVALRDGSNCLGFKVSEQSEPKKVHE